MCAVLVQFRDKSCRYATLFRQRCASRFESQCQEDHFGKSAESVEM